MLILFLFSISPLFFVPHICYSKYCVLSIFSAITSSYLYPTICLLHSQILYVCFSHVKFEFKVNKGETIETECNWLDCSVLYSSQLSSINLHCTSTFAVFIYYILHRKREVMQHKPHLWKLQDHNLNEFTVFSSASTQSAVMWWVTTHRRFLIIYLCF